MSTGTAKMSLDASDVQTDEDFYEDLVEDSFSYSADTSEKYPRTCRKRSSAKPPKSPRSPYLASMSVNPRRVAVAAWRQPRASLGDARGCTPPGDGGSACFTSLSNGNDSSQTQRSDLHITPELLSQALTMRKQKYLHAGSNGLTSCPGDHREKEDMYDEIIRLKKNLQAQKTDNQQIKVKLRRLEEDNAKREKQIEELLDPTRASEYTRSLVDKKKEGSVVLNGLKQRILKLEQQCREKENALSKLQSDLRTTNLEELQITVESYFEEIQRLRMLLEASEKSREERRCSQRQQKALSSTVRRLSENLKQLQQENAALREELDIDSPAGGMKGFREWSKQRLLRRLLEVEKRLEESKRHAHSGRSSCRLDHGVQVDPTEDAAFAAARETLISVGTMTEEREQISILRERLSRLEEERAGLEEQLSNQDDEVRQWKRAREEQKEETERWKRQQTEEQEEERRQHQLQLEKLTSRIHNLESEVKAEQAEATAPCVPPSEGSSLNAQVALKKEEEREASGGGEEMRDTAASVIQRRWREHRERDVVLLQWVLRGHLVRASQLSDLRKDSQDKTAPAAGAAGDGELDDDVAVTAVQSALRGHLTRCSLTIERNPWVSNRARSAQPASRTGLHQDSKKQWKAEHPRLTSIINSSRTSPKASEQTKLQSVDEPGRAAGVDSDDSDDVIVSPSRPVRRREVLIS
ncbi:IQ domain-containing protein E isoform X2 [Nelusetta ayraudi]|uniref:IQ domain-containing protein E isoform X2 n=1 Tax=Nelusetta ayraudi TaxID=303726 RepID=UPI003F717482